MKVDIKKIDKIKRTMIIQLEGEEFLQERDKFFLEAGKDLKVSGFRPGKIPLDILIKHHGEALSHEFLRNRIPYFYANAIEQEKLEPVNHPNIYDVDITNNGLKFSADFEVKPEIELDEKTYKNITVDDKKVVVEEIEIEKAITGFKEDIKKYISFDLDDNKLANWAGYPTIAEFKEAIRTQIYIEKLNLRRQTIIDKIINHLLQHIKLEPPQSVVERQHKYLMEKEIYNLKMKGVAQEDIDKYKKDLEEKSKSVSYERVKLAYILEAIGRKENIKGKEEDLSEIVIGYILSSAKYNVA